MKTSVLGRALGAAFGGCVIAVIALVLKYDFLLVVGLTIVFLSSSVLGAYLAGHANSNRNVPTSLSAGLTISIAGLILYAGSGLALYWIRLEPEHAITVIVLMIAGTVAACTIGAAVKIPARA